MWIERNLRFDLWTLLAVISLTGIGIVMIYSTSSITAEQIFHAESTFFLKKQLFSVLLGMVAMALAMHLNYEKLRLFVGPLLLLSLLLLIAVLIPGIGVEIKGSRRWLRLAGFSFQPSELARLALVLYLAHSLTRKQDLIKSFTYGVLPYLLISGLMIGLIFVEPDMGGAVTLGLIVLVMLFAAGTRLSYLMGLVALSVPAVFYFMASAEYRWRRVKATINPWDYWHDAGWQLVQSLLAFGSGGIWGVGLGKGRQKLFYLPDAHTDFILSVIGEELGIVGVVITLGLFALFTIRGMYIGLGAGEPFGAVLAVGVTVMIAMQAIINMGVVLALLPTKGLTLPFVSYGGTSLLVNAMAVGILLNISSKAEER